MTVLNIADDFSPTPFGRRRRDGDRSGEAFREDVLFPRISEAIRQNDVLVVNFEGLRGLSASFLEEAFGGLVRLKGLDAGKVIETIRFEPEESHFGPYIELTRDYIRKAQHRQ